MVVAAAAVVVVVAADAVAVEAAADAVVADAVVVEAAAVALAVGLLFIAEDPRLEAEVTRFGRSGPDLHKFLPGAAIASPK